MSSRALVSALAVASGLAPRGARAEDVVRYEEPPTGLVHEAVTSGRRGVPIPIKVEVQNGLTFDKLVLAYRAEGDPVFRGREMKPVAAGTYRAEIPAEATRGRLVAYYLEARDQDGAPLAGRASPQSPLVVSLSGELPWSPTSPGDGADEDERIPDRQCFFVALLVGTGAGWTTGYGDTNADTMIRQAAVEPAWLGQLVPEIGYWVSPVLMISIQGRFQTVTGTNDVYAGGRIYHTANYAAAGFVKATWQRNGLGRLHPFFSLAAGYGQIRHVVTFDALKDCGPSGQETCVDTIAAGPVAAGPGVGLFVALGDHLYGVFQLDAQLTMPAYSVNLDGNFGIAVRF